MCKQDTYAAVTIGGIELATIDACIAPIVQALNDAGIETVASCCGHGELMGIISLKDGRELLIARNYEEARRIDKYFYLINHPKGEGNE